MRRPVTVESFYSPFLACFKAKISRTGGDALRCMQPLALPTGDRMLGPNDLPIMSNFAVHELFVSALSDPNLWIADEALREIEIFDFFHSARSDECIVIFPNLRNSVRLSAGELKGISISGTVACMPGRADSD